MNIPSAGKQITLLHDDSLSKNLKLVSVQPPARQAVIYMTMRVPELSFSCLKVGVTKTNHAEASVPKYWYRTSYWSPNLPARTRNCFFLHLNAVLSAFSLFSWLVCSLSLSFVFLLLHEFDWGIRLFMSELHTIIKLAVTWRNLSYGK